MRFRYSPEVDILMVYISEEAYGYGEDNEGVIVHHAKTATRCPWRSWTPNSS